ncbi:uncharacterized protein LOC103520455 [Diaphorina citri]|uniref:Uncharacterized protein LOC103520455 n=1 Tax=Diaphorina citri TaxID=121845 RepID=A0A3Q0JFY6_DIACI|nr:uncharacterized protein LOC103520455 [Diaphorina citri]
MATSELSTGKTIFVLTVVAGCFAVLWPKIFYPMFFGSPQYVSNLEKAQGKLSSALRENGRVIPHEHIVPRVEPDLPPRPVVKHPGSPKPGMGRPSFGGTGPHQAAKQGGGIMNLLMPMYTISIVAFFIYTMLRFISNSSNNGPGTPSHDFYSGSAAEFRSSYYGEELCSAGGGGGRKQLEDGKTAGAGSEKTGPRLGE